MPQGHHQVTTKDINAFAYLELFLDGFKASDGCQPVQKKRYASVTLQTNDPNQESKLYVLLNHKSQSDEAKDRCH